MMAVNKLFGIDLDIADKVVAATACNGYVLVITERGAVYKVYENGQPG